MHERVFRRKSEERHFSKQLLYIGEIHLGGFRQYITHYTSNAIGHAFLSAVYYAHLPS